MDFGVLFVSPSLRDARLLAKMLVELPLPLVHAASLHDATGKLAKGTFPVILSEADLEDGNWLDALKLARLSDARLIVTRRSADATFWAQAINLGAYDLLAQPFQKNEVLHVLSSASGGKIAVGGQRVLKAAG